MKAGQPATIAARPDAFISYSRRDKDYVESRLAVALEARGKQVWLDLDDIRGGASDWRAAIWAGIEASRIVVFVLTPSSLESEVCQQELAHAAALNKRVIPVLHRSVEGLPVPEALSRPNWIYARDEDDFETSVSVLVTALETDEAWLDTHARLTQRTVEWLREDRDKSYLLRGSDLRAAERWLDVQATHAQSPTSEQVAYIHAGRHASARRQRMVLGGVVLALAVSIALGIVAFIQRQSARSQAYAARAIDAVQRDPEEGLKLALHAAKLRQSELVARALREAVAAAGWAQILRDDPAHPVNDVDFSPDHRLAITGAADGTAAIWDVRSGRQVATLHHDGPIHTVQFSPDGQRIVTAASDGTARLWNASGRSLHVLKPGTKDVWSAAFDRLGHRVITGTDHGSAQIWDAASGALRASIPGRGGDHLSPTTFSPDGRYALTSGGGGSVRIWTTSSNPRSEALRPPAGGDLVTVAAFSPSSHEVLTGDASGGVCLFAVSTRRPIGSCHRQPGTITDASFNRNGSLYVTASAGGTAVIRPAAAAGRPRILRHNGPVNAAAFSPVEPLVVTAGDDRTARIWTTDGRLERVLTGHTAAVFVARFSRDGAQVLTGSDDGSARVWATHDVPELQGRPLGDADVAFSPDSRRLLAISPDGHAAVWDLPDGRPVSLRGRMLTGDSSSLPCGRLTGCGPWSPDSLSIAGADSNYRATIWDARTGIARPLGPRQTTGAAFNPNGRSLVVLGIGPGARVVDRSGKILATVPTGAARVASVRFAASGRRILTVTDVNKVQVWDLQPAGAGIRLVDATRGESVGPIPRASDARAAAIAPGGGEVTVGTGVGAEPVSLQVHDLRSGTSQTGTQHLLTITSVAFDRSGQEIVSASDDGSARVWNANRLATPTAVLRGRDDELLGAAFSPDHRFVLTSGAQGTATLWDPALETSVLVLRKSNEGGAELSPDGRLIAIGGSRTVELRRCDVCAGIPELVRLAHSRLPAG